LIKVSRNGKKSGRKRELDAVGCLGLVLHWYRTRGSCARALSMAYKYPVLTNVWGACDGLKLRIKAPTNYLKQNYYYNGWTHGHYDSTMADYGVYDKMKAIYVAQGGKVVVDSAFGDGNREYLIKSAQQDPIGGPAGVAINRAATSVRQLSEWGMRTIQAQFPRLKDAVDYEENGERKVILQLMVLLYNYQCVEVGINQILNSFMAGEDSFYGRKIDRDASNIFNFN
jgi:hypothetical protein